MKNFFLLKNNLDFDNNNFFHKFIYIQLFINSLLDFTNEYIKYIIKKWDKNV